MVGLGKGAANLLLTANSKTTPTCFAISTQVSEGIPYNVHGEVSEWPKETVSKTVVGASPPWVRIPPSPPSF